VAHIRNDKPHQVMPAVDVLAIREATSWDVTECDVCGAPVLFLADDTSAYFAQIHLDGDSLEDLVAVLIDLSGDDEDAKLPEGPALEGRVESVREGRAY